MMEQIATRISEWLREQVSSAGAKGLVVGLSGGVDSACTAALAKRAVGDQVLGVLMPCHSDPVDGEYARMVADKLGIETIEVDLGAVHDLLVEQLPQAGPMAVANIKPRLRMTTLYYLAAARNYLVAGTGNKSELMIGYFTKYGDGGVDLEPLGELFKGQVWDLARYLGIPQPIIDRAPTAGLWDGQTDEGEMGLTYEALDRTLKMIEMGGIEEADPAFLSRVNGMILASEHKRNMPPSCPLGEGAES
jgi:NAD+ synthase